MGKSTWAPPRPTEVALPQELKALKQNEPMVQGGLTAASLGVIVEQEAQVTTADEGDTACCFGALLITTSHRAPVNVWHMERKTAVSDGNVHSVRNGDVQSARNGDVQSARNGDVQSARDGDVQSASNGDVQSARNGDVQSARNGDVQSSRDGDVQSARDGNVQSSRDGDVHSAGDGDVHSAIKQEYACLYMIQDANNCKRKDLQTDQR